MKIAVRYYTKSGNTKKLADAIAGALGVTAEDLSVPLPEGTDLLFLGSSVYAAGVDPAVKEFLASLSGLSLRIACFGTAALLPSTYRQVRKLALAAGLTVLEREFHCRGSFQFLHRGRPNTADCHDAADFAREIVAEN